MGFTSLSPILIFKGQFLNKLGPTGKDKFYFCFHLVERYSRGYKNRAIVQKMFEISPIFNDSVECQLFIQMTFFDSRKDLTCMVGPFFCPSVHVGRHRRPWLYPIFFLLELFTRCLVKILLDVFKKIQYLKKWGLWPSNRKESQGQPFWAAWAATVPSSRASWLNKESPLRYYPFGKKTAVAI